MKLENGQVAVVTGAASGIGFGLAEALGGRGLVVVLADVEAGARGRTRLARQPRLRRACACLRRRRCRGRGRARASRHRALRQGRSPDQQRRRVRQARPAVGQPARRLGVDLRRQRLRRRQRRALLPARHAAAEDGPCGERRLPGRPDGATVSRPLRCLQACRCRPVRKPGGGACDGQIAHPRVSRLPRRRAIAHSEHLEQEVVVPGGTFELCAG